MRRILFLALVGLHLGYGIQIWSPQSFLQIQQVELTQRRPTEYIIGLSFTSTTDYTSKLQTLSLLPTRYWHEYLDIILFCYMSRDFLSNCCA